MRYAREHLAHGGKLFRLDELFFEPFEFRNITAGKDDAFNFSGFVGERAEIETDATPFARLVANANFERGVRLASRQNIREEPQEEWKIFRMSTSSELHIRGFGDVVAENLFASRANKSVMRVGIHDENQIREAVHEAAGKFLLLVELTLHLATGGDVQNGTLITNDAA